MTKEELLERIKVKISEVVGLHHEDVDEDEKFLKMGISSIQAIKIVNALQEQFNAEINPAIMFEYETLSELVDYLIEEFDYEISIVEE